MEEGLVGLESKKEQERDVKKLLGQISLIGGICIVPLYFCVHGRHH